MKERAEKMKVTDEIIYVGVNNHDIDLFEGQYIVPNGMAYNSYVITDDKTVSYTHLTLPTNREV